MEKVKSEKQKGINAEILLPEGLSASYGEGQLTVKGSKGEVGRHLASKRIFLSVSGNTISMKSNLDGKRDRTLIGTFRAHIHNMIKGCNEAHRYELKVCSGHFPMTVNATKDDFTVKNFLGEKVPRVLALKEGAKVSVEGDKVVVESTSKELAGQTAADIEKLTRRANYDTRIFQDGIFITHKDGKDIK